jgi:hypothetical protein
MEVKILTGRTHQIRVHMAHLDIRSPETPSTEGEANSRAEADAPRVETSSCTPSRAQDEVQAPFPEDFKSLMDQLPGQEEEN